MSQIQGVVFYSNATLTHLLHDLNLGTPTTNTCETSQDAATASFPPISPPDDPYPYACRYGWIRDSNCTVTTASPFSDEGDFLRWRPSLRLKARQSAPATNYQAPASAAAGPLIQTLDMSRTSQLGLMGPMSTLLIQELVLESCLTSTETLKGCAKSYAAHHYMLSCAKMHDRRSSAPQPAKESICLPLDYAFALRSRLTSHSRPRLASRDSRLDSAHIQSRQKVFQSLSKLQVPQSIGPNPKHDLGNFCLKRSGGRQAQGSCPKRSWSHCFGSDTGHGRHSFKPWILVPKKHGQIGPACSFY